MQTACQPETQEIPRVQRGPGDVNCNPAIEADSEMRQAGSGACGRASATRRAAISRAIGRDRGEQ
jgi:hypothetical protein